MTIAVTLGVWAQPAPPVSDAERVRALVAAGALPKSALDKLRENDADLADETTLGATLFSSTRLEDLNENQCATMLAAAERRVERRERRASTLRPLVEAGLFARAELTAVESELAERRRVLELARGRAEFLRQLVAIARQEQAADNSTPGAPGPIAEHFDGRGAFGTSEWRSVLLAYEKQFGKALPISAFGETAVHRALGYDHRGRVDIALSPDQAEGEWLLRFLEAQAIPYYAFRGAIAGKATAAHIHIGPPSLRVRSAD